MKINSFFLLPLLFSIFSSCQSTRIFQLQKQGKILTQQFVEDIPFKYYKKSILIEATIDNHPYTFIYDTGAEITVLDELVADKISLKKVADKSVDDSHGNKKKLPFNILPNFKIGNVDFENFVATTVNLQAINDYFGCEQQIAGILGNNIFRKAVWKIDYQKEVISFANTLQALAPSDKSNTITFPKRKIGNIYLAVTVNGVRQKFTFDTGYAGSVGSNHKLFGKLKAKNADLPYTGEKGITSISLYGYNYGIINHVWLDEFKVEGIPLQNTIIALKDKESSSSLLGNEFWKNFIVTIDWKNGVLYLEKVEGLPVEEFAKFEYSIRPNHDSLTFKLSNQWLSHPTTFDINPENIIQSINGIKLTDLEIDEFCDFKDNQLPKLEEGEEMQIVVKEEETLRTITLYQQQLLPTKN